VSLLARLGWDPFFERQRAALDRQALRMARVIEEQRGLYRVAGEIDGAAEVSGRFRHDARGAADFPAIGDWIGCTDADDRAIIQVRLDRKSTLSRLAAGPAIDEQVLAANVETIFLVTALDADLSARRLERYLTMVWNAGAVPVVLLNKADLNDDPAAACESIRGRLPLVDVLAISAVHENGLDALAPYLRPAHTVALLGSSGVGKSTIVNRLLGSDRQPVAAIRESDGKGRHTTTSRQLFELPGGALLIDTPGMRELQLWADDSVVAAAFDDIASLARECRFADCAHAGEPGCAVVEALDTGRLDPDRLANYQRLLRETAFENRKHDKAAAAETKRRWKQLHKAQRALYRDRNRLQ
jgi:ribosome biogenesis GTPase / thiamine phosphate phosphatase